MAARWRKEKNEQGLAKVCQRERGYELQEDGTWIIMVSPFSKDGRRSGTSGWYWYGIGRNTYAERLFFETK